ncbi:hypothetical protein M885DRAFT_502835 [Pelagophyceae sp. CCMP2097]|nr:hypothetical protein M885DRAFT_502835 [Pelagophyceae sp. CCMP2097]
MLCRLAFLLASAAAFGSSIGSGSTSVMVEEFSFKDFEPYFSYTGSLEVSGSGDGATFVRVRFGPATFGFGYVDFNYELSGVDPDCEAGASTVANSCGIHIHEGTSCDADDLVDPDPWASVVYAPDSAGDVEGSHDGVAIGYMAVIGRVMVVHDFSGGRIACATIVDDSR